MSHPRTHIKCSICNRSLTLWNANTCTKCGKKMCSHHTHLVGNPHSFVLSSVCFDCADQADQLVAFPHPGFSPQQTKHAERT